MPNSDRIDLGLPAETKLLIEHAATINGVTVTDFVVSSAHDAALKVIADHDAWIARRNENRVFVGVADQI